jgi:hypothetical protein
MSKKKRIENRLAEKATDRTSGRRARPGSEAVDESRKKRRRAFILTSVVIVIIAIIVSVSIYISGAPYRRTIITVDGNNISMGYFLKRAWMASGGTDDPPSYTLYMLTEEELIKLGAQQYGIEASEEDIDEALRETARGDSESISDSEFREWYRQQLNETRLSDSEYRDLMHTSLLTALLHQYLAQRVSTIAEHIHLLAIVPSADDTDTMWERYDNGESLIDIGEELWSSYEAEEMIIDFGWMPPGVLEPWVDDIVFELTINEVSNPVLLTASEDEEVYYIFKVSEQEAAREVDEETLGILMSNALDVWLSEESDLHEIRWYSLYDSSKGFDNATYYWIMSELAKMGE